MTLLIELTFIGESFITALHNKIKNFATLKYFFLVTSLFFQPYYAD